MTTILTKSQVDVHLRTIVGANLVQGWWNSPNRQWNGKTPLQVWSEEGGAEKISTYVILRSGV